MLCKKGGILTNTVDGDTLGDPLLDVADHALGLAVVGVVKAKRFKIMRTGTPKKGTICHVELTCSR